MLGGSYYSDMRVVPGPFGVIPGSICSCFVACSIPTGATKQVSFPGEAGVVKGAFEMLNKFGYEV